MKSPPSYQESVKKKEQLQHQNDFMFGNSFGAVDTGQSNGGNGAGYSSYGQDGGSEQYRFNVNKSPSPSVASLKQQLQSSNRSGSSSRSADQQNGGDSNYFSLNRYSEKPTNGAAGGYQSPLPNGGGGSAGGQVSQTTSNMNRFTNEIERELTNLTLKIEKDLESQQHHQSYKSSSNKPKPPPPPAPPSSGMLSFSFSDYGQSGGHKATNFGQCCECMKEIQSRADSCLAMGNLYHNDCFLCASCGRTLRDKSFYHINNKNYCEEDYLYSGFLQNAEKCSICGHIIVDMILQACGKSYHPGCFRCSVCNESLDGLPFTLDVHNKIYCIQDYYKKYAPKCHGCGHLITPAEGSNETVRVVSMEKDFHVECYVCRDCGTQLTDENEKRCYPLDNCLLCLTCHLGRLGGSSGLKPPKHSNNNGYSAADSNNSTLNDSKSSFTYPPNNSNHHHHHHQSAPPPPPPPPPSYYQSKQSVNGYY